VTDIGWIRELTQVIGFLMPWPVRVFSNEERDKAIEWLSSLPEGPGVSHRLVPESELIVIEVKEPLRAQDFDALALTADTWLETHGELHGLVIHARQFPGWENVGSLVRHVRSCATIIERSRGLRWQQTASLPLWRPASPSTSSKPR
jgi:stage II sporulation SpoAA-like protein